MLRRILMGVVAVVMLAGCYPSGGTTVPAVSVDRRQRRQIDGSGRGRRGDGGWNGAARDE